MTIVFNPNANLVTADAASAASPLSLTINGCTGTVFLALAWGDSSAATGLTPPAAPSGFVVDATINQSGTNTQAISVVLYRKPTLTAGTLAVSLPFSSGAGQGTSPYFWEAALFETTPVSLDKAPAAVSTNTAALTGPNTGTLTQPVEFAIALCGSNGGVTPGIPNLPAGFTSILGGNASGAGIAGRIAQQITSVNTALNPSWTSTSATSMAAIVATYADASTSLGRQPGKAGPGVGPDKRAQFTKRQLSSIIQASSIPGPLQGISVVSAIVFGQAIGLLPVGPGRIPPTGPGIGPDYLKMFAPRQAGTTQLPSVTFAPMQGLAVSQSVAQASLSGAGALQGTSVAQSVAQAALSGSGSLAGTSLSLSIGSGAINGVGALQGLGLGQSIASALLNGAGSLQGLSVGQSIASGVIGGAGALAGLSIGQSIAFATMAANGSLSGISISISTTFGLLTALTSGSMTGMSVSTSYAFGLMSGAGALSGRSIASSNTLATLSGSGALGGLSISQTIAFGQLSSAAFASMTGISVSSSVARAALTGIGSLSGIAQSSTIARAALSAQARLNGLGIITSIAYANPGAPVALAHPGHLILLDPSDRRIRLTYTQGRTTNLSGPDRILATDGSTRILVSKDE
jgi:hypothetical protein